ncbi:AMP-binding protein [Nocardioides pacificus]
MEQHFGDGTIVTNTAEGVRRTTYAEWAQRTRRLGGMLDPLGVTGDGRVGTFGWNSQRYLELYFAAPCTGRVLHTLNIRLFPEQLTYVANHAEDEVVFVDRSVLPLLWPLIDTLTRVRHVVVMEDGGIAEIPDDPRIADYEALLAEAKPVDFNVRDENLAASMCYTSGTTGNPKGVVYSHRSTVLHTITSLSANAFGMGVNDVAMPIVPMFHANAWVIAHAAPAAGADLVLPGPLMQSELLADLSVDEGVTFTAGVPTIWQGVLPHLAGRPHRLREIGSGGSAVPKALSEAYREQVGLPILRGLGNGRDQPIGLLLHPASALRRRGRPHPGRAASACRHLHPRRPASSTPPGCSHSRGTTTPRESRRSVDLGAPRAITRPMREWCCSTEDGWMRTGDVAAMDAQGSIRIADRTKDLIKSGGEWISSVDLENAIMSHPKVAETAVVAVPHPKWDERPLACVVLKPGETATEEEILDHVRPLVAKWWLPDAVEFIDEVPKTSVGKFSKKDLRARFSSYELT